MQKTKSSKGFTLIEILVVIGIIAILATIVIIAINPARQFAQARNSQRTANVNAILNAVGQRMADNKGIFAGTVGAGLPVCPDLAALTVGTAYNIASTTNAGDVNLSCLIPTYIPSLPTDPEYVSGFDTLYDLRMETNGRISICADGAEAAIEGSGPICVTR